MRKKDPNEIAREFKRRQSRQIVAILIALFFVLLFADLYTRPVLFVELSKATIFGAQIATIAAFMGFSAVNWRCPSCGKSLGSDITKRVCKKCGTRLN